MTRTFIGLASGSSLFGVDAALVRVDGVGESASLKLEHFTHLPHSRELRELLWSVTASTAPETRQVAMVHRVLGETYALAVRQLLQESRRNPQDVWCVACPGLTLWHAPEERFAATMQLGMPSVLAERTGLTVISRLAERDLAVGGKGVPLTAAIDAKLLHQAQEHRVHLHLGSVATLVSLPAQLGMNGRNIVAFEAAPATMLLDGLMRLLTNGREQYDAGGKHAVQGRCLEPLVERWLRNHFFQERPPRCVPRREFGQEFLSRAIEQARRLDGNLHDVLCTMTHFIASAIVHAIRTWLPAGVAKIVLSGRGVRNGFLWNLLEQKLAPIPLEKCDALGLPGEAIRAIGFAGLAARTLDGTPTNWPAITGASGARVLGQLTPGTSDNWARCLAWMARQVTPLPLAA